VLRYGQLYAAAVLRPLAEQLALALAISPGHVVCDVLCDGGELTRACSSRVAPGGRVIGVEADDLDAPAPRDLCDRAGSLFTHGFHPGAAAWMRAALGPGGAALIACWDPSAPPPCEASLSSALAECGAASAYLDSVLAAPPEGVATRVQDVVRFDGIASCWTALVTQGPLAAELAALPHDMAEHVRSACHHAARRYEAADGTLRIPVSALFVRV